MKSKIRYRKPWYYGLVLFVTLAVVMMIRSEKPTDEKSETKSKLEKATGYIVTSNRLAAEKSPYLLQHAKNPVDWYPWGEEAFEKAQKENKPIFLSVGYSTCHWCHVMEHESFENPEIARYMNEHFVNIKVDREERPDVDKVYMAFVQATTGGGGWPMSVWLTPDLKPVVGGTYFPPSDKFGRPGFLSVLKQVNTFWLSREKDLVSQGEHFLEQLRGHVMVKVDENAGLDDSIFEKCYDQIAQGFDSSEGGFSRSPKFPRPVNINFLLRYHQSHPDTDKGRNALVMSLVTLEKMAKGGMHDHLGGGFHRYSVDAFWHVPHFEKMLYDQAQLTMAYLEAYQITGNHFQEVQARDILDYVLRDLTDSQGGFYSAEDADSLIEHGKRITRKGPFMYGKRRRLRLRYPPKK